MESGVDRLEWIGRAPTRLQATANLYVGVTAIMIAGLQPLLLGTLQLAHRLSAAELGRASTAELLTMGVVAGLAGALLPARHLRGIGLIAGLALAAIDVATMPASGFTVTLLRGAAGIPSGLMMWLTISMITRSPRPEQWSGLFLTVQTLAQFLLSSFLAALVIGRWGADGGFLALALMSLLAAGAALISPAEFAPLAHAEGPAGLPPLAGFAALAAAFLVLACLIGVFVYAEPLSHQAGHAAWVAGAAISVGLGFQVIGGLAATLTAHRLPWYPVVIAAAGVILACLAVLAMLPGPALFLITQAVFGFAFLFTLPFLVPMVIAADPTRRAAMLIAGAQLLGGSLGPLLASMVVSDADARGVLVFGGACLVAAMAIATALRLRQPATVLA